MSDEKPRKPSWRWALEGVVGFVGLSAYGAYTLAYSGVSLWLAIVLPPAVLLIAASAAIAAAVWKDAREHNRVAMESVAQLYREEGYWVKPVWTDDGRRPKIIKAIEIAENPDETTWRVTFDGLLRETDAAGALRGVRAHLDTSR